MAGPQSCSASVVALTMAAADKPQLGALPVVV
jgi:hypothetical protein